MEFAKGYNLVDVSFMLSGEGLFIETPRRWFESPKTQAYAQETHSLSFLDNLDNHME